MPFEYILIVDLSLVVAYVALFISCSCYLVVLYVYMFVWFSVCVCHLVVYCLVVCCLLCTLSWVKRQGMNSLSVHVSKGIISLVMSSITLSIWCMVCSRWHKLYSMAYIICIHCIIHHTSCVMGHMLYVLSCLVWLMYSMSSFKYTIYNQQYDMVDCIIVECSAA